MYLTPSVMNSPLKNSFIESYNSYNIQFSGFDILTDIKNHNHSQFYNIFITSKKKPGTLLIITSQLHLRPYKQ